jgi:hypothetical protein
MERSHPILFYEKENQMKNLFKWLFLVGLLVAIIATLVNLSSPWLTSLLILVAVLAGIFFFDSDDVVNQGIRYLVLVAVAAALDKFIGVGPFLTAIFSAAVAFIGPAVLTVLVVHFVKKYFFGSEAKSK